MEIFTLLLSVGLFVFIISVLAVTIIEAYTLQTEKHEDQMMLDHIRKILNEKK